METPAHEIRVTPWVEVANLPAWDDSNVSAYRIFQRASQWGWEQAHEWRGRDGTTYREAWIRGVSGWLPHARAEA